MKDRQTVYYTDERNDDFAASSGKINTCTVGSDFNYRQDDVLRSVASFILHRFIAVPLAYCYLKLRFGMVVKNREALDGIDGGFFLYGNHTQGAADAFIPSVIAFPRKTNVIVGPDAVSIPIIRSIVPLLGGMPLSSTPRGRINFFSALKDRTACGDVTAIYPEAHIWPYYNGVRDFPDDSFMYPMRFDVPAVGFTVTYRERRWLTDLPPLITVTLSDPVYPSECSSRAEMRDRIHDFMKRTVETEESVAYIEYVKAEDGEANDGACV